MRLRLDMGDAWRSASAGAGLAVLVLGRREEQSLLRARVLIVSFGVAYHLDQDLRAETSVSRIATMFGFTWGFRVSRSFAFPTLALFAHYDWVLDPTTGDQHDVMVGIQLSAATPFALPFLLSR
jgi:hypothetical protein